LGDDTILFSGSNLGQDIVNGGDGLDVVDFSNLINFAWVDLQYNGVEAWTKNATAWIGVADLTSVENITGSAFNDQIWGSASANKLIGGLGNDTIDGRAGNDQIYGGDGNDSLVGGIGSDVLDGGNGIDTVSYSASTAAVTINLLTNTYSGGDASGDSLTNIENITGSLQSDVIIGNILDNRLNGGGGNDTIEGGVGKDAIIGGAGDDRVVFSGSNLGQDVVDGGDGTDIADFSNLANFAWVDLQYAGVEAWSKNQGAWITVADLTSIENVTGSAFNDQIWGNALANKLIGGAGNDSINGRDGDDTLGGMNGNDTLTGGNGADTFYFSVSNGGSDTITDFAENADNIRFDASLNINFGQLAFSGQGSTQVVVSGFDGVATITVKCAVGLTMDSSDFLFA
jgi:Ca2+-binding RTX toxin-like protein